MENSATEKQIKLANILLNRHFGMYRKLYLFLYYHTTTSKTLTFSQAREIIDNFSELNPEQWLNIEEGKDRIKRELNQVKFL